MGMSQLLGNAGPRITTNSMGNMVGGGNLRNISSGGLSMPGLSTSLLNLGANSGSGLGVQGQNRMMGGLPQGLYDLSSSLHFLSWNYGKHFFTFMIIVTRKCCS